jgi:hypothetical protein
MSENLSQSVDLGAWLGRGQAFAAVANQCSAVQADCLRNIRESKSYAALGVTWDDFCKDYVGLTSRRVDAVIRNLEDFGYTYFRLADIIRISPEQYRQLAPHIRDEAIDIDGRPVPITPENAARIRAAILHRRAEFHSAAPATPPVDRLRTGLDGLLKRAARLVDSPGDRSAIKVFLDDAVDRLTSLARQCPPAVPAPKLLPGPGGDDGTPPRHS